MCPDLLAHVTQCNFVQIAFRGFLVLCVCHSGTPAYCNIDTLPLQPINIPSLQPPSFTVGRKNLAIVRIENRRSL
jgi:hypothetical protein